MRNVMVIAILAASVLVGACSSDKITNPEKCARRTSPDSLLRALATTYNEQNSECYADLLHDDFIFVFVPEVAESLGLPPNEQWWGRTTDIEATGALFEDSTVTEIWFSYELVGDWFVWEDVRTDTTFTGICRRLDPLIEVKLQAAGIDTVYRVDNSWLDITLVPDTHSEDLWVALRIQEHLKQPKTSASPTALATRPSSLSLIKALWAPD